MKTVFEIESWLRRGRFMFRLEPPSGVGDKFGATVLDASGATKASGKSATLADAIENVMIELRANAQPQRSPGLINGPITIQFSSSSAPPAPPTNGHIAIRKCPMCGFLPRSIVGIGVGTIVASLECAALKCGAVWIESVVPGDVFGVSGYKGTLSKYRWDGNAWSVVP